MVNTEFYKNANIYKIVDNTNGNIYVGSTCKKLCQRLAQHRRDYKLYNNGDKKRYVTSSKILENNDFSIILIENVENCENIEQLRARERYYIESLKCVNKNIPNKFNIDANSKYNKEYQKLYYQELKQEINEKHNKYYLSNIDKLREKHRKYNSYNRNKLREKFDCPCGGCYCHSDKAKHFKTNKHQKYVQENPID